MGRLRALLRSNDLRANLVPSWATAVPIAAVCVLAGGALGFVELIDEVVDGETHATDEAILLALRSAEDIAIPIGPHWLHVFFRDVTALGGYPILVVLGVLAAGYLVLTRHWNSLVLLAGSAVGGLLLSTYFKGIFNRPRPDFVTHLVEVQTASFPSGHATGAAVMYLTLGALLAQAQARRRTKLYIVACSVALALLVGTSRIYLGVHYPTDVLAGWCLGAAWAMMCWLIAWWTDDDRGSSRRPRPVRSSD